ncbi:MAG: hypothetical protein ACYTFG_11960, partial [Planctomycetota bacterium]
AAIQQGSVAAVGYEYTTPTYASLDTHSPGTACTYCHGPHHSFDVAKNAASCNGCHTGASSDIHQVALDSTDYDGNASTTTVKAAIDALAADLYAAIQEYGANNPGSNTIVYNPSSYPYWFDGGGSRYNTFTARLLKAVYNYQVYQKEHGAWAHNGDYMAQLLIDSIQDLEASSAVSTNYSGSYNRP